jgi:hypothetical protein
MAKRQQLRCGVTQMMYTAWGTPCHCKVLRSVIARPEGSKQCHSKGLLKNQYRDTEKHKDQDPKQPPLDQPPQRLPFFFINLTHLEFNANLCSTDFSGELWLSSARNAKRTIRLTPNTAKSVALRSLPLRFLSPKHSNDPQKNSVHRPQIPELRPGILSCRAVFCLVLCWQDDTGSWACWAKVEWARSTGLMTSSWARPLR